MSPSIGLFIKKKYLDTIKCTMLNGRGGFKMTEFYFHLYRPNYFMTLKTITKNTFFDDSHTEISTIYLLWSYNIMISWIRGFNLFS